MKFDTLEIKIQDAFNISYLHSLWIKAHKVDPNWMDTIPYIHDAIPDASIDKIRNIFCRDGTTTFNGNYIGSDKADIMFILKEHNITNAILDDTIKDDNEFWFDKSHDSTRNKYMKRLSCVLSKLCPEFDTSSPIGYMNLNKRGGLSNTNTIKLTNYVRQYHKFILRQIEITEPSVIILCGCWKELSLGLLESNSLHMDGNRLIISDTVNPIVMNCPHPATIRFNDCMDTLGYRTKIWVTK